MPETNTPATAVAAGPGALPSADEDWTGRALGEFHIVRLLGRGGMGQVFLAEQKSLKRKVALKILRPELAANKTALQRFRTEAESVARLNHANIVQIHAIGEQDGIHYMALEYVEGRNLRDYLNRKGPPDLPIAISIMRQIAAALQRASEQGFVHRDIKPENILLTRKGEVKVTDFGLTRCLTEGGPALNLTQSGVAMGTPLYMSPEQVQGKTVDPRSDIYSFGVTCYHMLSGQPPFRGASAFDVAIKHVQSTAPPLSSLRPDLPAEMCALVHRMMAKKPEDRFENCREILRELSRIKDQYAGGMSAQPTLPSGVMATVDPSTLTAQATSAFDELPSVAYHRQRNAWMKWAVLGIILVGMLLGGIAVRMLRNRIGGAAESNQAQASTQPPAPVVSKDERFALDSAQHFADPDPNNSSELKKGLTAQIDLGVLYLKEHRLDEAEKFFRSLTDSARTYRKPQRQEEHPYRIFGQLGLALVLGYRDNARESLDKMERLLENEQPIGGAIRIKGIPIPIDSLDLRKAIADVLNRNAANLKIDKFAGKPAFEQLRRPPVTFGKPDRPFRKP